MSIVAWCGYAHEISHKPARFAENRHHGETDAHQTERPHPNAGLKHPKSEKYGGQERHPKRGVQFEEGGRGGSFERRDHGRDIGRHVGWDKIRPRLNGDFTPRTFRLLSETVLATRTDKRGWGWRLRNRPV